MNFPSRHQSRLCLVLLVSLWISVGAFVAVRISLPALLLIFFPVVVTGYIGSRYIGRLRQQKVDIARRLIEVELLGKIGHWTWDLQRTLVLSDEAQAILKLTGVGPDLPLESYLSSVHPDDRQAVSLALTDVSEGRSITLEHGLILPDGIKRRVLIKASPETKKGKTLRVRGMIQDITDQVQVRQKLEQSQERFETMFRHSPLPTVLVDRDTRRILDINEAFSEATGYDQADVTGKTSVELGVLEPDDECELIQDSYRSFGSLRNRQGLFWTRAGERRHNVVFTERLTVNGKPCLYLQFRDITAEKLAQEQADEAAQRFTKAFEATPIPNTITSFETGEVLATNDAFCQTFRYSKSELLGEYIGQIGIWPTGGRREEIVDLLKKDGRVFRFPRRVQTKDGDWKEVLLSCESILIDGKAYILSVYEDVTEENRMREEIQLSAAALANAGEAVSIHDAQGQIVLINDAFTRDTGYTLEDIKGHDASEFVYSDHTASRGMDREQIEGMLEIQGHWEGESWFRRKNGEVYPRLMNLGVVRNEQGEISHYVAVANDITKQKAIEAQLEFLAHHDALTGLPNRALFNDRCEHALRNAERSKKKVGLLYLDLDKFKQVNDTFGHLAGDAVLKEVSQRMTEAIRATDTLCRLGGDEFVVLLQEITDPEDAENVARKLIAAIQPPLLFENQELQLSTSLGIAWYPEHGKTADSLVAQADAALYKAKQAGRNNYQVASRSKN